MEKYRVRLATWSECKTKFLCPQCGKKTFVKYIDTQTYNFIHIDVGMCDRKFECGYHYPPHRYFKEHGYYPEPFNSSIDIKEVPFNVKLRANIDMELVYATLNKSIENKLINFLYKRFNSYEVDAVVQEYCLGTSDKWDGATIFWQIDANNKARTGKIILYDEQTGKRIKEPNRIAWFHTAYMEFGYRLNQCLYGEHLINKNPEMPIGIVESEKTALIATINLPDRIWLATGGLNNFNETLFASILNRKVEVFPDTDAFNDWRNKAVALKDKMDISVSTILQEDQSFTKRFRGADLADYLLME